MHILSRRIGRLPFVLVSILLYLSVPLYYAAWEYETVSPYVMEPAGLIMDGVTSLVSYHSILGSGIPFCFGHQIGVLDSLEFTAPFALLLLLVTLWRCNDCRASRLLLIGQCLPLVNLLTLVYLTVRERAVRPARRYADHRPVERDQEPVTVRWSEAHRHIA